MTHTFSLRFLLSLSLTGLLVAACSAGNDEPVEAQQVTTQEVAEQGSCCEATSGVSGCSDSSVESCVCGSDSYCCLVEWDEACVTEVEEFQCGTCSAGTGGSSGGGGSGGQGGGGPLEPGGACCSAGLPLQPTCTDPTIAACVCALTRDPFCCLVQWDEQCVAEVEEYGCATCSGGE